MTQNVSFPTRGGPERVRRRGGISQPPAQPVQAGFSLRDSSEPSTTPEPKSSSAPEMSRLRRSLLTEALRSSPSSPSPPARTPSPILADVPPLDPSLKVEIAARRNALTNPLTRAVRSE